MQYTRLGSSGLWVSRLCLGCMSFGEPGRGQHAWTLDEDASRPLIAQALDAGINFFDTANSYSDGASEEITGRALASMARRDEVVIATKLYFPWSRGPNAGGLGRKAILQAADDSLRRLGTDYIDLLQIHRFDPDVPIAETMDALDSLVRAGKVRYLGASSMPAWRFLSMQHAAERAGGQRFVSMQPQYNLLYREEEREMLPLCLETGVGVIPWSPLARGLLTRPRGEATARSGTDAVMRIYAATEEADTRVINATLALAEARNLPPAQIALAWVLRQPAVTAPIIGATKPQHLTDALAALDLTLTDDEAVALESPYIPHPVAGVTFPRGRPVLTPRQGA
jgi:aryl-alcohol dehydrogenase-like predicted oxidoreductase